MLVLLLGVGGVRRRGDCPLVGEAVEDTEGQGRVPENLRDCVSFSGRGLDVLTVFLAKGSQEEGD